MGTQVWQTFVVSFLSHASIWIENLQQQLKKVSTHNVVFTFNLKIVILVTGWCDSRKAAAPSTPQPANLKNNIFFKKSSSKLQFFLFSIFVVVIKFRMVSILKNQLLKHLSRWVLAAMDVSDGPKSWKHIGKKSRNVLSLTKQSPSQDVCDCSSQFSSHVKPPFRYVSEWLKTSSHTIFFSYHSIRLASETFKVFRSLGDLEETKKFSVIIWWQDSIDKLKAYACLVIMIVFNY